VTLMTPRTTASAAIAETAVDAALAVEIDLRPGAWLPALTGVEPGIAAGVRCDGRLRVAVVEFAGRRSSLTDLARRTLARTASRPVTEAAAALAALDGASSRPSVAVADLSPDGILRLALRDAPPAILLSPDRPARAVVAHGPGSELSLRPEDSLLLCSATFLEDPPSLLRTVRGSSPGQEALDELQRALPLTRHPGATALVRRLRTGPAEPAS